MSLYADVSPFLGKISLRGSKKVPSIMAESAFFLEGKGGHDARGVFGFFRRSPMQESPRFPGGDLGLFFLDQKMEEIRAKSRLISKRKRQNYR